MSETSRFLDLLSRLRAGEDQAATDLYAEYAPRIRLLIQTRLRNLSLQRVLGEEDICQSVMKSFFLRCRLGQYDVESPEQLCGLLARMARNKLFDQHRRHMGVKRGRGQIRELPSGDILPGANESPSTKLNIEELSAKAQQNMTPSEREIHALYIEQRLTWTEIAAKLGGTAESRRKQWERVRDRLMQELGLES